MCITVCILTLLQYTITTDAGSLEKGRILFISAYSYGWDTVQIQIEGIKAGVGPNVVVDYEFMDTKRVNDETSAQMFYEGLAYRMSQVEPYDVVILGDDAALLFAMEHQDDLFAGIPLVFEGVNDIFAVSATAVFFVLKNKFAINAKLLYAFHKLSFEVLGISFVTSKWVWNIANRVANILVVSVANNLSYVKWNFAETVKIVKRHNKSRLFAGFN